MAVTEDGEPAAGGTTPEAAATDSPRSVNPLRDAFVAGRDIVFNLNVSPPWHSQREARDRSTGSGRHERDAPGLGKRLFTARVGKHSGRLAIAFGAEDTLVVTEQDGTVHRWSLTDRAELPGAPGGGPAPLRTDLLYGMPTQVAVSTATPAVAVARGARCTIVQFTDGEYQTSSFPLRREEVLLAGGGRRFATYDGRRMLVRDFADSETVWEQPCPRFVVATAMDMSGATVAIASAANMFAAARKFAVMRQGAARPAEFTFENLLLPGAGCRLGLSPDGGLAVCASFREILLARPDTGKIVRRRRISGVRDEIVPTLGLRPQRLICMSDGRVLWLRGRRVVDVQWSAPKFHYLPQDGLCDDIDFDHARSRLAMVSESGQLDVFEWLRP